MLDSIEKISKIVLSGIASTVIAIAGFSVEWEKLGLEQDSWCFEHSDRAQNAILRRTETIPDLLIRRYSERCGVSFEQAARVLNEERVISELSDPNQNNAVGGGGGGGVVGGSWPGGAGGIFPNEDQSTPSDDKFDGFVALGKSNPLSYSHVNFNDAVSGEPSISESMAPEIGSVLQARWSVNLRQNTSVTTAGRNPILSVIDQGECVVVAEAPEVLRGQFWAAINRTACP